MAIYVRNKDLLNEMKFCKDSSLAYPDTLIEMFTLISTKLSQSYSYKVESDRQDCIQGGIMDAFQYWNRFNPQRSTNAFSYVTQIIKNGQFKVFRKLYPYSGKGFMNVSINNIHTL